MNDWWMQIWRKACSNAQMWADSLSWALAACFGVAVLFFFCGGWEMGDGRWEMGDGRWEMGDGRWEMGDGRWEMGDGRWEMGDGRGNLDS
jgi:hypothetical protein